LPITKTRSAALDRNLDVLWDEIVAEMKEKGRNRPCESFWIACGVKEGQDFMRSRVDKRALSRAWVRCRLKFPVTFP
jgi:hypothetical protein